MGRLSECWMDLKYQKSMHWPSPRRENISYLEVRIGKSSCGDMMMEFVNSWDRDIQEQSPELP